MTNEKTRPDEAIGEHVARAAPEIAGKHIPFPITVVSVQQKVRSIPTYRLVTSNSHNLAYIAKLTG